jgi:hypothetical protein
MRAKRFPAIRVLAALAASVAAGACGGGGSVPLVPEAEWTPIPTDGVTASREGGTASWDFGAVRPGERALGLLEVANRGSAPMTVVAPSLPPAFSTDVPAGGLAVPVGQSRRIQLAFAPTAEDRYEWTGAFTIAEDGAQGVAARLAGVGQAPRFSCDADALDFGRAVRGQRKTLVLTCRNDADVDGVLAIGAFEGNGRVEFVQPFTADAGRVPVASGRSLPIAVTFRAAGSGPADAVLPIESEEADGPRRVARVRLSGTTLDRALACAPSTLDFGFVAPGSSGRGEVVCTNQGSDSFHLTALELAAGEDPRFAADPVTLPLEVPAAVGDVPGELRLGLAFAPRAGDEGRWNGALRVSTDDPGATRFEVAVTGFAGGPVITCAPASLDFGIVATGFTATRSFLCANAGADDPFRTDDALVIQAVEPSDPAEFRAEVRGGLDPAGLPVGGTFTVDVTYAPVDDGVDDAPIRLRGNATNAGADGTFVVPASGHGRDLPPCDFELVPRELQFGIVEKGRVATLDFAVRNHLPDAECLVQHLRLASTCDEEFTLPEGAVELAVVPADSDVRFPVQFAPREYRESGFACDVLFDISDPATPHRELHVTGASVEPCALIAPNDLDFGVVEPGCATRDREFEIFNLCGTPLRIDAVELAESASDEFFVRSQPPAGTVVPGGGSVAFTVAYRPDDLGVDLGAVFVHVDGMDQPYTAMLRGEGAHGAVQTDRFVQNERPKVDVLWVIDNSGSMSDEQDAIAENLAAFLSFAEAQHIDYQIGITTTGITPSAGCPGGAEGGEDGRLFPVDNSRPRILTPDTPDLAATWAANIRVGTCHGDEQPMEAALRALTPPLSDHCDDPRHPEGNDGNCGFLRPEAHLSIIDVSDEWDQSPGTVNFYYGAFQSLKGFRSPNLFNFHAITVDRTGGACTGPEGTGDRAIALVEKTAGGVYQPICAPNWEESLRKMSAAAFGFLTCFDLDSEPADVDGDGIVGDAAGELEVRLNGVLQPSHGAQHQTIWTYEPDQVSICFSPLSVPEPGMQIEVQYPVACNAW